MDPVVIKTVDHLVDEQIRNKQQIGELGSRYRARWAVVVRLTRGLESGLYVLVPRPDLSRRQRLLFRYAFRGRRWAVLPYLPYALTGLELVLGTAWVAAVVATITLTGIPPLAQGFVALFGLLLAVPVAIMPGEWCRSRMYNWYALLQGPPSGSDLEHLAALIRNWPKDKVMPQTHWPRLYEIATWAGAFHKGAMNGAFVPAMCQVVASARDSRPLAAWLAATNEVELTFLYYRRPGGPLEMLDAIEAIVHKHRDRELKGDLMSLLLSNDRVLAGEIQELIDRARSAPLPDTRQEGHIQVDVVDGPAAGG